MKHFYKKIIPKINIALPFYLNKVFLSLTKDNGAARQHKLQYKDGVAMQDNVAQHPGGTMQYWCEHNFKYW